MPNANKPIDVNFSFDISDQLEFYYGDEYDIDLNYELVISGSNKEIQKSDGKTIVVAPGLNFSLRHLETLEETDPIKITGPTFITVNEDGSRDFVITGNNLNEDPLIRDGTGGFVLTSGRFTFSFDSAGNLTEPLSGRGHITDLIDLLI